MGVGTDISGLKVADALKLRIVRVVRDLRYAQALGR
jgi:hypothetical protein